MLDHKPSIHSKHHGKDRKNLIAILDLHYRIGVHCSVARSSPYLVCVIGLHIVFSTFDHLDLINENTVFLFILYHRIQFRAVFIPNESITEKNILFCSLAAFQIAAHFIFRLLTTHKADKNHAIKPLVFTDLQIGLLSRFQRRCGTAARRIGAIGQLYRTSGKQSKC